RKFRLAGAGEDAHYPQMFMSGTRNRLARSVPLACAFALAAPAAVAAQPAASELRVQLDSPAPTAQRPSSLPIAVTGLAPARCAPTIRHAGVQANNLNIELAPPAACTARSAARFYLRSDQAPVMPGQVYRTRIYVADGGTPKLLAFGL